ncbi:hypothetical protein BC940DRAFT_345692 [Gongronella butleri]|nr:hypothetical protein BC940DRAFT_345692 [Gongronella butleri]
MAQAIDVPVISLCKETKEDLASMWHVFSKCKNNLENGRRLENLSWRLWYRDSFSQQLREHDTGSVASSISTIGPATPANSVCDHQQQQHDHHHQHHHQAQKHVSVHSTLPMTPSSLQHTQLHAHQQPLPPPPPPSPAWTEDLAMPLPSPAATPQQRRPSKFFVDDDDDENDESDENDENEEIDDMEDDDDLWSTVDSRPAARAQAVDRAYKRHFFPPTNQQRPICSKPPVLSFSKQQQCPLTRPSLLSALFQCDSASRTPCTPTKDDDELPAALQSSVDWEQAQNRHPHANLGASPFLPTEDMVW